MKSICYIYYTFVATNKLTYTTKVSSSTNFTVTLSFTDGCHDAQNVIVTVRLINEVNTYKTLSFST